jgi:prepilin-type N-terminal cleavage/methylation domain-containing protein
MKNSKTCISGFRSFRAGGFSLLELIVVLVIIGLVVAIGLPGINTARANAEREMIRTRAVSLQNAKLNYISALGTLNASAGWIAQANDQSRYANLLIQYLPATAPAYLNSASIPNPAPAGALAYVPSPFSINLGAGVGTSVIATDADGVTNIPLQKY